MKKWALSFSVVLVMLAGSGMVHSDDDWAWSKRHGSSFPPVVNQAYAEECGSCHFAYQPALLPAASWRKLLSSLDNHFGEYAELSEQTLSELKVYLDENAADKVSGYKRADKIMRSLDGLIPMRITDIPYIHQRHHEIPSWIITDNSDIRSLSNCSSCHIRAATGSYAEREIRIPGISQWDDD